MPELPFPACLETRRLLIPGRRLMLGRKILNWINSRGLQVEILGEFDDAALMKAFGAGQNAIFIAPALDQQGIWQCDVLEEVGRLDTVLEEYHIIFAERIIQHPAVQRICYADFSALFPRHSADEKNRRKRRFFQQSDEQAAIKPVC